MRLRRWLDGDAASLLAAWSDPAIARETTVPEDPDLATARRWIAGSDVRAATGIALELVVGPVPGTGAATPGPVWGEVGLTRLRLRSGSRRLDVWEVGWWVLEAHRGRGVARRAARLLLDWADAALPADLVVARIRPGNGASEAVATALGLAHRGPGGSSTDLWARPSRRPPPREGGPRPV